MKHLALLISVAVVTPTHLDADDAKKADGAARVNFTEHVLPIFRQHCLKCHNANEAKGGLAIDSYAALMEGGGSGEVVFEGDAPSSRLYQLITHEDTPVMPPKQDPLPKQQLEVIHQWINGGLLENSGSKRKKKKGPSLSFTSLGEGGKPKVISMPDSVWRVPVVTTERAPAASAIATSPWAPLVAVGGHRQVSLYHTETGELLGIIPFPEGIPQVVRFSTAGDYMMIAGGTHASLGTAAVYDVRTGERKLRVGQEVDTVFGADVNGSMTHVAMGGPQRMLNIYDTSTGEAVFNLKKHTDWIYCVDYSPDGILLASGDRAGGLHVWEADTGRLYMDLVGHKAAIRAVAWRADSNVLASASEDGTVKMWEMTQGKQLKSFVAHGGGVTGIAMASDGRIATSGKDRTVKLWKADGAALKTYPAFAEPALEVAISLDGTRVVGGDWLGRTVVWDANDPTKAIELAANPQALPQQHAQAIAKLQELEAVVVKATERLSAGQKAVDHAKTTLDAANQRLTDTKAAFQKATASKIAMEKELSEHQTQLAEARKNEATAKGQAAKLATQIQSTTNQHQATAKQLAEATARRDAARKEKTELDNQLGGLVSELSSANKSKAETQVKLAEVGKKMTDAKNRQAASAASAAKAEADQKAAEVQLVELEKREGETASEIQAIRQRIAALSQARDAAIKDKDAVSAEITEFSAQSKVNDQEKMLIDGKIAALIKQLGEWNARAKQLAETDVREENARASAASKLAELGGILAKQQAELTAVSERKKSLGAAVAELAAKVSAKPTEIANQAKQNQQRSAEIPAIEKQIALAKKTFDQATADLAKAKSSADTAAANVHDAKRRAESLQVELAAFGQATTKLAEAASAAERDAQQKNAALQGPTAEAEKIKSEMASRGQALAQVSSELKKLQAQLEGLQKTQVAQQQKLAEINKYLADLNAVAEKAAMEAQSKQDRLDFFQTVYGSE